LVDDGSVRSAAAGGLVLTGPWTALLLDIGPKLDPFYMELV